MSAFEQVSEAAEWVRSNNCGGADVAVVLGSGLGDFADHLDNAITIPYSTIPRFPASRVIGHAGKLVCGQLAGKKVETFDDLYLRFLMAAAAVLCLGTLFLRKRTELAWQAAGALGVVLLIASLL